MEVNRISQLDQILRALSGANERLEYSTYILYICRNQKEEQTIIITTIAQKV